MNGQVTSKEKVRWTVVAGGDGYQTATVVGWDALELAFLRAHEPDATLENPGEFGGAVLAHLRDEDNWSCGMKGERLHYNESYEDGWVEVIRHTDDLVGTDDLREQPSHEPGTLRWVPLAERMPPENCGKVLVTNRMEARDAHDHLSHVWLVAMVHELDEQAQQKRGCRFMAFTEDDTCIYELTHWADPFAAFAQPPPAALKAGGIACG